MKGVEACCSAFSTVLKRTLSFCGRFAHFVSFPLPLLRLLLLLLLLLFCLLLLLLLLLLPPL